MNEIHNEEFRVTGYYIKRGPKTDTTIYTRSLVKTIISKEALSKYRKAIKHNVSEE